MPPWATCSTFIQLGLEAIRGQGRTRQLQKRAVRPARQVVNSDRDALLADTALATNEHRRRQGGQPRDDCLECAHLLAVPEDVVVVARRKARVIAGCCLARNGSPDRALDLGGRGALVENVGGARSHGFDRGPQIGRLCDSNDRDSSGPRQAAENLPGCRVGECEIQENDARRDLMEAFERLGRFVHMDGLKALSFKDLGEEGCRC